MKKYPVVGILGPRQGEFTLFQVMEMKTRSTTRKKQYKLPLRRLKNDPWIKIRKNH
ncbi:MAG: hypothetical protein NT010_07090 [Proteobacteria bacterium]|nr:hypothetical protein [Pseudomonadota bacterium]